MTFELLYSEAPPSTAEETSPCAKLSLARPIIVSVVARGNTSHRLIAASWKVVNSAAS